MGFGDVGGDGKLWGGMTCDVGGDGATAIENLGSLTTSRGRRMRHQTSNFQRLSARGYISNPPVQMIFTDGFLYQPPGGLFHPPPVEIKTK